MTQRTPVSLSDGQSAALEAAYAQPPRAYHNYDHVRAVLRQHAAVAAGPGWTQPVETRLAVLYHDAIYEAGRGDNEARSAEFAVDQIGRWMPGVRLDASRVDELIRLTARHGQFAPDDFDGTLADDTRHFLDCDMAVLGAAPAEFDAYDRGVAIEYRGHAPGWLFRRNRRRFLAALLDKPRIYLSDFFDRRLDAQARSNLWRAIGGAD